MGFPSHSNCQVFNDLILVLQPHKEPHVLNTFVQWPTTPALPGDGSSNKSDPTVVLLRLSGEMDLICAKKDFRDALPLFRDLEEAVARK